MDHETKSTDHEDRALPDYKYPPVVETVLSVQFDPLLNTGHLGLLWDRFRGGDKDLILEEKPPIQPVFELFGETSLRIDPSKLNFSLTEMPPVPRCWLVNEKENTLIQIQSDRFIVNWRKPSKNSDYIRFRNFSLEFDEKYKVFIKFLKKEDLFETYNLNQCEITYVNHISIDDNKQTHSKIRNIISLFDENYKDDFLPVPESTHLVTRFVMRDDENNPIGRLHVTVEPKFLKDGNEIFVLNLTARGNPTSDGVEGIKDFFEIGHEWIVTGFTALTTKNMHKRWERLK